MPISTTSLLDTITKHITTTLFSNLNIMSTPTKPGANGSGEKLELNQREIEVMAMAFMCISDVKDGVPQVRKTLHLISTYRTPYHYLLPPLEIYVSYTFTKYNARP